MERRGSGLRKIVTETEKLPGYSEKYKPEFFSSANDFRVILKNVNYDLVIMSPQDTIITAVSEKILSFCSKPQSKKDIALFCDFKDLKYFTTKYIHPLLESGELSMTLSNKPQSKYQKYITVKTR